MGWWKVQATDDVVGDEVFSLLRNAAVAVAAAYQREFERPPTRTEWERLVRDAIEPVENLESSLKKSLIAGQKTGPRAVHILLEERTD
jgi:hypothetical protein